MLERSRAFLSRKGLEEARLEADLLVAHALGVDRLGLLMRLDQPVSEEELVCARELLTRRGRREPAAYIIGQREFYSRNFAVQPGVLIPRPESELLVDLVRDHLEPKTESGESPEARSSASILDVGTGSGCIGITLALELPACRVQAVDCSEAALRVARANAEALGAELVLHQGDGLQVAADLAPLDVVVSNPPYVRWDERDHLELDVVEHEPGIALFAPDGDPHYWVRELCRGARSWLNPGGLMLVELGHEQGDAALEYGRQSNLTPELKPDLNGVDRVLVLRA